MSRLTPDHRNEADACLAALTDASLSVHTALRRLNAAPDASGLAKTAIELQLIEIRQSLDNLMRRLDEMPTA